MPTTTLAAAMTICPTPLPCHCLTDDVVNCAFMRLEALPYFLEFSAVWSEVDLSENFLTTLPDYGLHGIRAASLRLQRNSIAVIGVDAFRGVGDVEVLDLSHNRLAAIVDGRALAPLVALRILRLQYNQLTALAADAFSQLPALAELDLTGNEFRAVPSAAVRGARRIRRLVLRHNRIRRVDAGAFAGTALEHLDLGNNPAPLDVDAAAFCGLEPRVTHAEPEVTDWSGLQTLLLDHNGMSALAGGDCVVRRIWTLTHVDLSGNPLRCDCATFRMLSTVGGAGSGGGGGGAKAVFPRAQCATPDYFAGLYLADLRPSSFRDRCGGGGGGGGGGDAPAPAAADGTNGGEFIAAGSDLLQRRQHCNDTCAALPVSPFMSGLSSGSSSLRTAGDARLAAAVSVVVGCWLLTDNRM